MLIIRVRTPGKVVWFMNLLSMAAHLRELGNLGIRSTAATVFGGRLEYQAIPIALLAIPAPGLRYWDISLIYASILR